MSEINKMEDEGDLFRALQEELLESEFFKKDHEEELIEEIDRIEPIIWLLKGEQPLQLTDVFQPTDLLTLIVNATSPEKMTYVKMIDSLDQVRYHAKTAGKNHRFTTRLQNTRTFGEWRLEINIPLLDSNEIKTFQVPFSLVEKIEDEDPLYIELLESDSGYLLVFLDEEEEMFQMVQPQYLPVEVQDDTEELTDDQLGEIPQEIEAIDPIEADQEEKATAEITKIEPQIEVEQVILADLNIPINEIKGIGPATKKKLEVVGVLYIHHFLDYEGETLASASGLREKQCAQWIALARGIEANPDDPLYVKYRKQSVTETEKVEVTQSDLVNQELANLHIPLSEISGVGPATVKKFNVAGISEIHELVEHTAVSLVDLIGVPKSKAEKWILQVRDIATNPDNQIYNSYLKDKIDNQKAEEEIQAVILEEVEVTNKEILELNIPINEISGIGPATMKKFEAADLKFVHHLLPFTVDELAQKTGLSSGRISKWKAEAETIANDPNNETFAKFNK